MHGIIFPAHSHTMLSESNFSTKDLDNISTDPHINHSVILARSANKNSARPFHLESLLDQYVLLWLGDAVGDHPCSGTSRR
jgi:hypothetical protein